jgi:hypothetical protein
MSAGLVALLSTCAITRWPPRVAEFHAGCMTNNELAGDSSPRTYMATPARPSGLPGKVQLRAATPDAVLAVVPHMLGFYPSRSLVVLGLGERSRVVVTFRYDLPDPFDYDVATDIAEHADHILSRERIAAALLVGYGPAEVVAGVAALTSARLIRSGVDVSEVLRADSGRYWSLLCDDSTCCPPEGRSYDPGSHPAAAAMAEAGLAAHPDRDALARTIQRPAGSADRVSRATLQAQLRLSQLVDLGEADGDRDPRLRATRTGRREVQRAIRRYRSGGSIGSIEHLAWLAVLLADLRVRDDAWARMDPAHHEVHCRLWTDVLRAAAVDFAPAPASLLAFTAWQSGNGALAAMAVDRALAADPGYSMAQLLAGAVEAALPPSAARMPMSPAAVAASYAVTPAAARGMTPSPRAEGARQAASAGRRGGRSGKRDSAKSGQGTGGQRGRFGARPGAASGRSGGGQRRARATSVSGRGRIR